MSIHATQRVNTAYFGKIPTRGDFVKNASHPQLMASLDNWVAHAMGQLEQDLDWKTLYDNLHAVRFAFLGSRSKLAIAGHLQPSRDQAGRRFPFLCATSLPVPHSLDFIARSPMAFSRIWGAMERSTQSLMTSTAPDQALSELDNLAGEVRTQADDGFDAFIDLQTIDGMVSLLAQHEHTIDFHDLVLALGALMTPLQSSGRSQADQGLLLPLPRDPLYMNLSAAFWLSLITPFLARGDFELAVFVLRLEGRQRLAVGLRGAHPDDLASLISTPAQAYRQFLCLDQPAWIKDLPQLDSGQSKLSSYLRQPRLSLRTVRDTFHDVFTGA
ncbi:type VI secretion system-associated protein TagF [Alcaligenes sp. SDU_A2]|uniref:type VI secretion system-associated protein TagF n=1 Tax=Alcaligenes sp. SDU_A2 TaxID=3136634 RepID=UPI00311DCDC3